MDDLSRTIEANMIAVRRALVRLENQKRVESGLPSLDAKRAIVGLPMRERDKLRLLNLKVWSLRHRVSVEYILDCVLTACKKIRKSPKPPLEASLGLNASAVTGAKAYKILLESLARDFPAGENLRATSQQASSVAVEYSSLDGMVSGYASAMQARQRAFAEKPVPQSFQRNFRKAK